MAKGYGDTFSLYGADYMPDWLTDSMSYQAPQTIGNVGNDMGAGNTPNYLYRQSFGGYGLNRAIPPADSPSWLDKMNAIGTGVQAFASLANLYSGFKGLQMQKDQFKFAKGAWNKNFAAQLGAYDNSLKDNYYKMSQGNAYFGNPNPSEDEWMASRSLSYLGS